MAIWLSAGWQAIIWQTPSWQAEALASWPRARLAPAQLACCPAFLTASTLLPRPNARSSCWLLDLLQFWALCVWLAGRKSWACSPAPQMHRHPSGVWDLQQRKQPKWTVNLCQRFQTADIYFQCKTNQRLHNSGLSIKGQFPVFSHQLWLKTKQHRKRLECFSVLSSILVHVMFSKTFFGIK